jgi:hypothetical protein
MVDAAPIQVDGVRDLIRTLNAIDPALRKELGRRNKEIGQRIIDASYPKPLDVGAGAGAKPKASATANALRIRAGTPSRRSAVQQWGARAAPRKGQRPYIRRAAEEDVPNVMDDYMAALREVAIKAGLKTKF